MFIAVVEKINDLSNLIRLTVCTLFAAHLAAFSVPAVVGRAYVPSLRNQSIRPGRAILQLNVLKKNAPDPDPHSLT
jgi:hypothetical protein